MILAGIWRSRGRASRLKLGPHAYWHMWSSPELTDQGQEITHVTPFQRGLSLPFNPHSSTNLSIPSQWCWSTGRRASGGGPDAVSARLLLPALGRATLPGKRRSALGIGLRSGRVYTAPTAPPPTRYPLKVYIMSNLQSLSLCVCPGQCLRLVRFSVDYLSEIELQQQEGAVLLLAESALTPLR